MAAEYVIYVHSEYEYIVRAFQFVAHMFGPAGNYKGLIWAIGVSAVLFGGIVVVSRQTMGGKGSILSWGLTLLFASVIILSVTGVKSQVVIHDVTTNRWKDVGQVPSIMAALAYAENSIEMELKELIEDIMTPVLEYDMIGRGKGFELLASFEDVGKDYFAKHPYAQASIEDYWRKCVVPDMTYGWITVDAINSSADMWQSIKSSTAVRFSNVYSATNPSGIPYACKDAWVEINKSLTATDMKNSLLSKCAKDNGNEDLALSACTNTMDNIIQTIVAPTSDMNRYIRSYVVAWALSSSSGSLQAALTDMNRKNASSAFVAEKTLPRLKGMMYGMMIGIFPFLVAFLWISPVKTTVFYFGMFILMVLWTTIDTFMDMQYQAEVVNMFAQMREQGLGVRQMFDIPNIAADAVSLYGQGRWMSLGLATAISSAITGVNNYALSQMGSQLSATAQGAAAMSAQYMDSAGEAKLAEQAGKELAYRETLSSYSVPNIVSGVASHEAQRMMSNIQTGAGMTDAFRGNMNAAAVMSGKNIGSFTGETAKAQALGFKNMNEYSHWKTSDGTITQNMADSMAAHGLNKQVANAMTGLKLDSIGINSDGSISNVAASGVGKDGKMWSVNESGIEARHRVGEDGENINGMFVASGASVTEVFNRDGNLSQLQVEGAGNTRFSMNMDTGYIFGSRSFTDDKGIEHTIKYAGSTATDSFVDNGVKVETSLGLENGEWQEVQSTYNGGGFNNFVKQADGTSYGTITYSDNGIEHTMKYAGSTAIDSFVANGVKVETSFGLENGEWREVQSTYNGGGFNNYVENADGTRYGTKTYTKDGVSYTETYNGVERSTSFINASGDSITKEEKMNSNGSYSAVKTSVQVGGDGFSYNGVKFDRGSSIEMNMGDGSYTVKGVSQYGDTTMIVGSDGHIARLEGRSGENLMEQHNKIFENITTETTDSSKINKADNIFSRVNSTATGNKEELYLNAKTVSGGDDVKGYNAANAMLAAGLSDFIGDKGMREAFTNNNAQYLSSFAQGEGKDMVSEEQALAVVGGLKAETKGGINLLFFKTGFDAHVNAEIKAALNHNSGRISTVDFNRIMSENVMKGLLDDMEKGVFNDANGNLDRAAFNAAAQERFGALESGVKSAFETIYGPGNGMQRVFNAAKDGMNAAGDVISKVEEIMPKTPKYGAGVYKGADGELKGKTWKESGKGFGKGGGD